MNRVILAISFLCIFAFAISQSTEKQTQSFVIQGRVKESKTLTIGDLTKFKSYTIGDVTISNHKGEIKGIAKGLTGILLKDILETVLLDTENPKLFSEYYFVSKASDGYKVVFSWNEIFNTATGNSTFIVTQKDNKSLTQLDESILLISSQDQRTGRRYVKNLETILVGKAE